MNRFFGSTSFTAHRPEVYRGEQPKGKGFETLKEMGIKTVISFRRKHSSREEVEELNLNYVRLPIKAAMTSRPPSDEQVKIFFETVLDPAKQPVYIHCKVGRDRTGTTEIPQGSARPWNRNSRNALK